MGATASKAADRVGPVLKTRVFNRSLPEPMKPEEIELLNKMALRDQERMKDLPSFEELNRKDVPLDGLLNKLGAAISPRAVDITGGQGQPGDSGEASTSGRSDAKSVKHQMEQEQQLPASVRLSAANPTQPIPEYVPSAARAKGRAKTQVDPDNEPGRVQTYMLMEILEKKNEMAAQGLQPDLETYARLYRADIKKIETLLKYNCLPQVGKISTFGHQYAFARPPAWFIGGVSGTQFKSEPVVPAMLRDRRTQK